MPTILYTLLAMALMPYVLAMAGAYCRVHQFGRFDNHHPRQQQAQLSGVGARVQAAQANAWEALSVYAVSIFIAFAAGLDLRTLDTVAFVYIAARIVYTVCYVANLAWLRSLVFGVGVSCCAYIVVLAGLHAI